VASVTVVAPTSELGVGETMQMEADVRGAGGELLSDTGIIWTSSNTGVVRVNATGLTTGVGTGTANIGASVDGVTGSATVAVDVPFPSLAGLWGVGFTFDLAGVGGMTWDIAQPSRFAGEFSGAASNIQITINNVRYSFSNTGLFAGSVTRDSAVTVAFQSVTPGFSWTYTGRMVAAGVRMEGRHVLVDTITSYPGDFTTQRVPTLRSATATGEEVRRPLAALPGLLRERSAP
jgi:hypothetical protein